MLPLQPHGVERPARRRLQPAAHHVHVALREADERDGQAGELVAQARPLRGAEQREARRVPDADAAPGRPRAAGDARAQLGEEGPDERRHADIERVVEVEVRVQGVRVREREHGADVRVRVRGGALDVRRGADGGDVRGGGGRGEQRVIFAGLGRGSIGEQRVLREDCRPLWHVNECAARGGVPHSCTSHRCAKAAWRRAPAARHAVRTVVSTSTCARIAVTPAATLARTRRAPRAYRSSGCSANAAFACAVTASASAKSLRAGYMSGVHAGGGSESGVPVRERASVEEVAFVQVDVGVA